MAWFSALGDSGCHRVAFGRLGEPQHVVRCPLRLGCCGEDGSFIAAQDLEPARDVACVPELAVDPAMRAQVGSTEFGDQLFNGV